MKKPRGISGAALAPQTGLSVPLSARSYVSHEPRRSAQTKLHKQNFSASPGTIPAGSWASILLFRFPLYTLSLFFYFIVLVFFLLLRSRECFSIVGWRHIMTSTRTSERETVAQKKNKRKGTGSRGANTVGR